MLEAIKSATESDAQFVWADENFLTENNVAPWSEMPFYLPESFEETCGFLAMNVDKALSKGLTFRPSRDTILDVLSWRETQDFPMRAGISAEREQELLNKLHEQL
jgi:2'-hydroxyisoflavone reductase